MQAAQILSRRSLDELEDEIVSLSGRINAFEYEFLVLIREFDRRQGWRAYHFNSCAEWLNMRCGIAPGTAREKIRVANALFDLPLTSGAFQSGQPSYSKARSLTRLATPETEQRLVDYAIPATAQQVDDYCRQLRNVERELSAVDSALVVVEEDEKGNPLNVGRKHRVVQPALKRALLARDRCCRFPGCTHEKWLDAHHVVHWADGGETSLDNTILLCSTHHRLLHEGAFAVKKDCKGEYRFIRARGS